ncbi:M20 metallopeptidase family protein [Sphingobacterium gobiense]|uniref:Amidohydrolase n=1 Tax=Sphingobacterium gobiense TaxID=1382456 RepID=A0A2S9JI62_9SPHI|nr:M20 family metallopeptidase [Sphingobacterium gobiense]PRD52666.1 amidohydrolase [Sphingobacterium gobiense]
MDLINTIKERVEAHFNEAVHRRQELHQRPELSFQEYQTAAYIKTVLDKLTIPYLPVAETGVMGWITGKKTISDDVIVLRADIDALPIQELNEISYKSNNDGVMHACGHDFHTSNLLGVATVLQELEHLFSGQVLLLFQPAEERIPGGAQEVLRSGVFDEYEGRIKAVLGLHVSPQLDVGEVGICPGKFMASSDEFYVRIKGKGGHAAEPHRAIDPVYIGAQLVSSLQHIISRRANPAVPSVLTFGRFIGNGAVNVIPDEVCMEGTFRTMDEQWRKEALERIEHLTRELPQSFGAEVELTVKNGYPFLYNNPSLSQDVGTYMAEILSKENVKDIGIWMAAEDFAYYSHRFPSLFFLVGVRNEQHAPQYGLHNAKFNLDEDSFRTSMQAMAYVSIRLLMG